MLAKKTSLRIFIISVIITSLFANAVTAQNITQDNHEKYQVTFDFRIVDAFSGEPLNGVLHVHAFVSDELWKESLEMGEWVEDIVVKEFSGGKISFNALFENRAKALTAFQSHSKRIDAWANEIKLR